MSTSYPSSSQNSAIAFDQKIVKCAKLIQCLACASESRVYKAVDESGTIIAVKICRYDGDRNGEKFRPSICEEVKRKLRQEASTHLQMKHDNIVQMHDFYESEGCVVMCMEYFDGEELESFLVNKTTKLGEDDARIIFRQISGAVHYIHKKGVVHCDLHMGNIMVNDKKQIKILDFGNAVSGENAKLLQVMDKFWLNRIAEILIYKVDNPTAVGEQFPDLLS